MPSVWSRISLACEQMGSSNDDNEELLFTLDTFINRALQHPLTVTIELPKHFDGQNPVLTLLINHTHRWPSFTNRSEGFSPFKMFSHRDRALESLHFPLLEEMHIADVIVMESELNMFVHAAPKIKKLVLDLIPNRVSLKEMSLFTQLSHFEFYYSYAHEIRALIHSYHLESLKTEESVYRSLVDSDAEQAIPTLPTPCGTIMTLCHDPTIWRGYSAFSLSDAPFIESHPSRTDGVS
ncbi:hypothetical protein BT96DRAFT_131114 [Gymnopus androsaceus JB14]|uniref:Uncharacterized protein n=1 Tax=Gymnopus androsaceus JB14 TaxID=1447944 RepID=A0A6A4IBJ1_9AGAR|nr:hypothetical protein BT96DRAFT_131114 [Gymnopus androsaceus JB14]